MNIQDADSIDDGDNHDEEEEDHDGGGGVDVIDDGVDRDGGSKLKVVAVDWGAVPSMAIQINLIQELILSLLDIDGQHG